MIPLYPEFKKIELSDKPAFDDAFKRSPPEISEYTFTNLYAWRRAYDLEVSSRDGFLIVLCRNPEQAFFPPAGPGDLTAVIKKFSNEVNIPFIRVPESIIPSFENCGAYSFLPDRDNFDYIFDSGELIRLEGRKYDGKRNFIRNFKSAYKYDYLEVSVDSIGEVLSFQDYWCVEKDCEKVKSLRDESAAVKDMLLNLKDFGLMAGALRVDGKICAVCVAEPLNPDTLVIHVLKGVREIAGVYQTVFNEFLRRHTGGFRYVNMEQDLGIEGLRRSKESYHPVSMVKKYVAAPVK